MTRSGSLFRFVALLLAVFMAMPGLTVGSAKAEMVATEDLLRPAAGISLDAQRAAVDAFMAREDVRRQLATMGVDPDEAAAGGATGEQAEPARR